jgi:flagellar biosynthesis/type III secretory pathway chaperone
MRFSSPAGEFADIAVVELAALKSFVELLEKECAALANNDADALPSLDSAKNDLIRTLTRCAEERVRVLDAAGVAVNAAEVRRFLAAEPQALQIWEQVLTIAKQVSALNTANGFVTNQRLSQVSRALALISGPRPSLYNTSGTTSLAASASRSFGSI